jgi:hypothetical protein
MGWIDTLKPPGFKKMDSARRRALLPTIQKEAHFSFQNLYYGNFIIELHKDPDLQNLIYSKTVLITASHYFRKNLLTCGESDHGNLLF